MRHLPMKRLLSARLIICLWTLFLVQEMVLAFTIPGKNLYSHTKTNDIIINHQHQPRHNSHYQNGRQSKSIGEFRPKGDTRLFSSTSKKSVASTSSADVVYQRVIKPTAELPDFLFLGYLVEYLESKFKLPQDLPMIYETTIPENEQDYVLAWDSPLSPSPEATRMEVEVVGIFTKNRGNGNNNSGTAAGSSIPSMAMVVVKKVKSSSAAASLPPMMKNLFADSEKRIINSLDRGLQDLVAGKIRFSDNDRKKSSDIPTNVKTADEAIQAELVDEIPRTDPKKNAADRESVIVDAHVTQVPPDNNYNNNRSQEKIKVESNTSQKATNPKASDTSIDAGFVETSKPTIESKNVKSTLFDSTATKSSKDDDVKQNFPDITKATAQAEDFAVAAARRMAKKKKQIEPEGPKEDFAVAAARKISATVKSKKKTTKKETMVDSSSSSKAAAAATTTKTKTKTTARGDNNGDNTKQSGSSQGKVDFQQSSIPLELPGDFEQEDFMGSARAFRTVISRPEDWKKKGRKSRPKVRQTEASTQKTKAITDNLASTTNATSKSKVLDAAPKTEKSDIENLKQNKETSAEQVTTESTKEDEQMAELKRKLERERSLNLNLVSEKGAEDPFTVIKSLDETEDLGKIPPTENKKVEVIKEAQKVMDDMTKQVEDISPEELLRNVLKFGEEKEKEEAPGSGFVSGAFEKANELMRERLRQRQSRMENKKSVKEVTRTMDGIIPDIVNPYASKELSPEEELRQMFQAGERIADGMITKSEKGEMTAATPKKITEEDIDRLIAEDTSISSYARILDDELAELEVAINKSPGEEFDGPMRNPLFDIMSGPEVYNPNVDPETVNYPGALPGTRDIRLPKELDEAVKQSKFAAHVLANLNIVKDTNKDGEETGTEKYFIGEKELSREKVQSLRQVVSEAVSIGLIPDPLVLEEERARLQMVIDEMWNQPDERFGEIASNYKDLLLSDNFIGLVKDRLAAMASRDLDALRKDDESLREPHARERELLGQLVNYTQFLLKQARALGAELEANQLEVIRSICKVAMDPSYTTEEETAMALTDAVRDMSPLLDDTFVAYLKYSVAEEEGRLARAGLLDDPEHNHWLFVLKIVQQGVYAEISKTIRRYIDHIGYVIRMKTANQRRMLLSRLIDDMPTLDVRPFVQVVDKIAASLGDGVKGDFDGIDTLGEIANKILQLHRDTHELLPPERIALKSRDADEWAAKQRQRLIDARKDTKQRLKAASETDHILDEFEAMQRRGDVERFDPFE